MRDNFGHGNHWECISDLDDLVKIHLPHLVTKGILEEKLNVNGVFFENNDPTNETVFSITIPDSDLSALALIVTNDNIQTNEFTTGYPYLKGKENNFLKIQKIDEFPNGIEAVIHATTEDDREVAFFDTKYYKNKSNYQIGGLYNFYISALAYNVAILENRSFSFDGEKAENWLRKIGQEPTYDDKGNIESINFDLSKLVSLINSNEDYPEDYEFQSPIESIEDADIFGIDFYKLRIKIFNDPVFKIFLYIKKELFKTKIQEQDPLRGVLWMQGYLIG